MNLAAPQQLLNLAAPQPLLNLAALFNLSAPQLLQNFAVDLVLCISPAILLTVSTAQHLLVSVVLHLHVPAAMPLVNLAGPQQLVNLAAAEVHLLNLAADPPPYLTFELETETLESI